MKPNVFVVTHSASPYQVELCNAVAARQQCDLHVAYLFARDPQRSWQRRPLEHSSVALDAERDAADILRRGADRADLVVVNYYRHPAAQRLMRDLAGTGKPFAFWGERPGIRAAGPLGRAYRRWKLHAVRRTPAPIWGIGRFAVERYAAEFGNATRAYFNVPYFSDLRRFEAAAVRPRAAGARTILFSGSLILRKGVDLLARAFARLARADARVRLVIAGDGAYRSRLESTLKRVADRVEFLGFQDWDRLPEIYARADVLCTPSRYDGWGLVVPEGLAAGMPVIGTRSMGAAIEFLRPGDNGWLIPQDSLGPLQYALAEAASLSAAELSRRSVCARDTVRQHQLEDGARRVEQAIEGTLRAWSKAAGGRPS